MELKIYTDSCKQWYQRSTYSTNSLESKHCTTYNMAKHLSKLLSPLQDSESTVKNTIEFIEDLKQKLSRKHKLVSFDVKSLFTNVQLNRTTEIILKIIYEKNEIITSITKNEMKEILILSN